MLRPAELGVRESDNHQRRRRKWSCPVRESVLAITFLGSLLLSPLGAQESSGAHPEWGLDLTIGGTGLAIGNIPRVNGIRINFRDYHLEEVNGLNLTLWPPQGDRRVGGIVRGLAVGLTAPTADRIQGISSVGWPWSPMRSSRESASAGWPWWERGWSGESASVAWPRFPTETPAASTSGDWLPSRRATPGAELRRAGHRLERRVTGVNFGGLARWRDGTPNRAPARGLAVVGNGGIAGNLRGGLAVVAGEGSATGLQVGGLAVVAGGGSLTGVTLGGLAVVAAEGVARGLNLGGLAVVGVGGVEGLSFGGLAVVSEEYVRGISLGGLQGRCTGGIVGRRCSLEGGGG